MDKKILVVDDEPGIAESIKERLEALEYRVIAAYSGKEGIEKAIEEKPDIILLDIIMPGLDGLEVLHNLKINPATYGIPIILLTAKTEQEYIFKSESLRATDYIIKPFRLEELIKYIKRYTS